MKRLAARICVFVILGAIVNVAVAWALVMSSDTASGDLAAPSHWQSRWPFESPRPNLDFIVMYGLGSREGFAMNDQCMVWFGEAGWPSLSVSGSSWHRINERALIVESINNGLWRKADDELMSGVPFQPLWPGFAINTVFYAFILWLVFAAPFALRRRRRIKRGLCPNCAYPVGTNEVCTECGAAVGSKAVSK